MPVAAASPSPDRREAIPTPRLTGAEMVDYTRPRATFSDVPLVRLVGWVLLAHGGCWVGSTEDLYERLREEVAGAAVTPVDLGGNASTFGRRLAAITADLEASGVRVTRERGKVDGVDRRRWRLWDPLCRRGSRDPEFHAFAAEMLVTDELSVRSTAAEIRAAYEVWAADREAPPLLQRPFWTLLRDEALRRGAYPTVIDERRVYKGLRLAHLPPPTGDESGLASLSETGEIDGEGKVASTGDLGTTLEDLRRLRIQANVGWISSTEALRQVGGGAACARPGSDARVAWTRTLFWIATAACLAAAVWVSLSGN